jgi:dienelactone hydrolase
MTLIFFSVTPICNLFAQINDIHIPDTFWIYKEVDGKKLSMSVFLPDNYSDPNEEFPVMVFFHGGSWKTGEPAMHYPDCDYWSKRDMVAVSVDYRLKNRDNVEVPLECVKDAKSAIRFLRKNSTELKIDTNRVVAAGGSAGGQLAAALATIHSETTNDEAYDLNISYRPNAVVLYNPYFKCENYLSPPKHIREGLPPMITFLGDKDLAITVEDMRSWHNNLEANNNESILYIGKGGKHGFCNGRNQKNPFFYWSLDLVDNFLVKNGVLDGTSQVVIPNEVTHLQKEDYEVYD